MVDVAYFLGGSLEIEDRRAHERDLVRTYYDGLIAAGVTNFTWEQCWEEYRRQPFWALAMAIVAPMAVERTARGDEMFMALLRRTCQQIIDLGSLDLLPDPVAGPVALRCSTAKASRQSSGSLSRPMMTRLLASVKRSGALVA